MNSRLNRPDYTARDQSQFLDLQCDHCEAVIGVDQVVYANVGGDAHEFCCHGCAAAFKFINDNGLAGFYQRRNQFDKNVSATPTVAKQQTTDWSFLDDPVEAQPYVSVANNGERQISVAVKGMYCPSCAWLIEKALRGAGHGEEGIRASVDLTCNAVEIVIENYNQKLSSLFRVIEQLGYQPTPLEVGRIDNQEHRLQNRSALKRIVVAGLGMMQVMTYAIAGYLGEFQGMDYEFMQFFALVSMLVATVVILYSGKSIFTNALVDVSHCRVGMDVPIALAILGAFVPSVYFTLVGHFDSVYFDSAVMFVFFILVTRFAEARARAKLTPRFSESALSLPPKIRVKREGVWQFIAPYSVQVGDQAELHQHQSLAFDGTVVNECISVDESVVTGEPIPRAKIAGDVIYAGSRLLSNQAIIKATESWDNSSLAKIDRLLSRARMNSTAVHGSGDSATRHFVLATLFLTAAVGASWWWIAPGQTLQIVLAMLVASCPCAFALAQPLATTAAVRRLRQSGVLVSNIDALFGLAKKVSWLFDKTGTLTVGHPKIVGSTLREGVQSEHVHWLVASLQQNTQHPLSQAFSSSRKLATVENQAVNVGAGVTGVIDGRTYYLGKPKWVKTKTKCWPADLENYCQRSHYTLVALSSPDEVLAVFELADQVRAGAASLIAELKKEGSNVTMVSGDNSKAVAHYAAQLGIDCYFADLLPADKHAHVDTQCGSGNTVVMVGDGTNDAPALHAADVGIALTSGTDVAQAQADVLLLNGRLDRLMLLTAITQHTQRVIAQNRNWALIYNAIALPLAAAGVLTPWLAVLGMTTSSLLVVLNASRLAYTPSAD